MCLYPRLITNPKYKPNKKNGGNPPPVIDKRVLLVPIGCQKCMECRKQKANEWKVRLMEEIKTKEKAQFVTLTFSDESIHELKTAINEEKEERGAANIDNAIAKLGVRRFIKRWNNKYGGNIRHWLITELGHNGTENIHLHGLLWTEDVKKIEETWKYGYIYIGSYVNETTVGYIVKYMTKVDGMHPEYVPRVLASQGMGKEYINTSDARNNKYKEENTKESYKTRSGHKVALPKYYRNNIYTDEEKEKLWIEKLNKEERWVNGTRIDISNGYEEYDRAVKAARAKNRRLGFGTNEKKWDEIEYHRNRRQLLLNKRVEEGKKKKGLE